MQKSDLETFSRIYSESVVDGFKHRSFHERSDVEKIEDPDLGRVAAQWQSGNLRLTAYFEQRVVVDPETGQKRSSLPMLVIEDTEKGQTVALPGFSCFDVPDVSTVLFDAVVKSPIVEKALQAERALKQEV